MRNLVHRLGADTRYVLLGFPLAVVSFALLVTGFAAGLGTAVIGIGLPVLAVALLAARGFAQVERGMLPDILGRPVASPSYRAAPAGAGAFRRAIAPLSSGQSWLDLLHGIVRFPVAVAAFSVVVAWWALTLAGLLYPLYGWILFGIPGNTGLPELIGFGGSYAVSVAFHLGIGVVAALSLPFVVRAAALTSAGLAQALLAPAVAVVGPGAAPPAEGGPVAVFVGSPVGAAHGAF